MAPEAGGRDSSNDVGDGEVRETEAQREQMWEQQWEQAEASRAPWYWLAKVVWIALLAVALFLLGHAMVQHHFFTGGSQNNRSTSGPTGP